jgi:hypothetical protein
LILLLGAALAGWIAGMIRARFGKRSYEVPDIRLAWLVLLAFVPQFFAFILPATRSVIPPVWISAALVGSQLLLGIFALSNLRQPGFGLLAIGLGLNLAVIGLNGGMMPISPETLQALYPNAPAGAWQVGQRFGVGKDIVLLSTNTQLWFLSDHFSLPDWIPYRVAFSLGDVIIAAGAFWLLFAFGSISQSKKEILP